MRVGIREAIFFVVLLAVPVIALFYVIRPTNAEIQQALAEIDVKQTRLDDLEEMTSKLDDLSLAIEKGRESIRQIEQKLPSEEGVDDILEQVWLIAKSNRLTVKGIESDKAEPTATYFELPLNMVVEGEFNGFYQFMLEMENLPRITRVKSMSLKRATGYMGPNREDVPPGWMTAEFALSIYFESTGQGAS